MFVGRELWREQIGDGLTEYSLQSGKTVETWPGLPRNLYEAVLRRAQQAPDKLAVEDSFGRRFTYRELCTEADRFASVLKYRFGVQKGEHIALMMYSSAEFAVAFLSVIKLGAVAVMLPTKFRKQEVCSLAEKSDLGHILCDTKFLPYFEEDEKWADKLLPYHSSETEYGFRKWMDKVYPECGLDGGYEDVSVMMFTSGTSSMSKGVLIANYSYMHAVAAYQKVFGIGPEDATVIPVPIYMITGLAALFGLTLYSGGTVYLQQFFKAQEVLRCVRDRKVTFLHAAPTVYAILEREHEQFPDLPSLRLLACGGGITSVQLIEKIHSWLPNCEFRTVYGMTETCSPGTILPENAMDSPHRESVGRPIPGLKMKAVDEEGRECPPGQKGEILMKGTNLLQGYYGIDTPLFRDGWLHTGDVGYFTEDGYCSVVGRIKDMINRGGEKIVALDVEKELLKMEGISDAAVVGIPDELYGESPAALVKIDRPEAWDEESIRMYLKGRLAGYKIPVKILFTDQIPLTPNGKPDKKNIKKLF